MTRLILLPILFALGTALFWGCYGPTIGNAQAPKNEAGVPMWSPFKPYVFIGVAYLVIGIIGGLLMMRVKGDSFNYFGTDFATAKWGFLAGCLGALGALCLTSAMMYSKGNSLLVMPIVFGGAVAVTALVTLWRATDKASPFLWAGIGMTVLGVIITAINTPHGHAAPSHSTDSHQQDSSDDQTSQDDSPLLSEET